MAVHQNTFFLRNGIHTPSRVTLPASAATQPGWPLMLALGAATGVEFLENTMVVLSSAHIQGGVGATPQEFVWMTAVYAMVSILVILAQPWLTGALGYRYYLTLSLLLDAVGTWVCGGARDVSTLVLARALQAAGGGALFTSCRILIQITFEGQERIRAIWFFAGGLLGGTALAPLLVSFVIGYGEWHWIFYACLPVVLACAALIYATVPCRQDRAEAAREDRMQRLEAGARYNYGPVLLFCIALLGAQFVMQEVRFEFLGQSPLLLGLLAVSVAAAVAFLWHQWHAPEPLLHLRALHASPRFRWGLAYYAVNYLLTYGFLYVFPIYCEQGLGFSVELMGRLIALANGVGLLTGIAYLRYGPSLHNQKWPMLVGLACFALAGWELFRAAPNIAASGLYGALILFGLFGMLLNPVALLTFQELEPQFFGHAYRMKNIVRQLCNTSAVAGMTVLLQHREQTHSTSLVEHFNLGDAPFMQHMSGLTHALVAHGYDRTDARLAALALLHGALDRQALLLSCGDAFLVITLITVAAGIVLLCQNRLK